MLNIAIAHNIVIAHILAVSLAKRKATFLSQCDSFWIRSPVHQFALEHINEDEQRAIAAISLIAAALVTESADCDAEYLDFERRIFNRIEWHFQNIYKYYYGAENKYPTNILQTISTQDIMEKFRGHVDQAVVWLQRTLDGREKTLRKHRPDAQTTTHNLAPSFKEQAIDKARDGRENVLGKHHLVSRIWRDRLLGAAFAATLMMAGPWILRVTIATTTSSIFRG